MPEVKFLSTTTHQGRRYAKGDVVNLDDKEASDLIAMGKVDIIKEETAESVSTPKRPRKH
jgi:hypothetical protein